VCARVYVYGGGMEGRGRRITDLHAQPVQTGNAGQNVR
jgi:hypothetical protein